MQAFYKCEQALHHFTENILLLRWAQETFVHLKTRILAIRTAAAEDGTVRVPFRTSSTTQRYCTNPGIFSALKLLQLENPTWRNSPGIMNAPTG